MGGKQVEEARRARRHRQPEPAGREPGQRHWDTDVPKPDNWSVRAFWNPTANLSLQTSTRHLHSP